MFQLLFSCSYISDFSHQDLNRKINTCKSDFDPKILFPLRIKLNLDRYFQKKYYWFILFFKFPFVLNYKQELSHQSFNQKIYTFKGIPWKPNSLMIEVEDSL